MVGERREDQIYRARHHEEPTEENRTRKQYEISHDQIRGQGLTRPRSGSAAARVGGRTGPEPSRCASLPPSRLGAPRREESGGGAAGDGKSRAGRRVRDRAGRVWRLINAGRAMPILFPLYLLQFLLIKKYYFSTIFSIFHVLHMKYLY